MVNAIKGIKREFDRRKRYFRDAEQEIAENNLRALRRSSASIIVLLGLFLLITPNIIKGWVPSIQHILFLPAALIFYFIVRICCKRGITKTKSINALCIAFEIMVLSFIVMIDAESDRTAPSSFMALMFVIFPACFVYPTQISYGIIGFFEVVYIIAVSALKTDDMIIQHDIFVALVSLLCSVTLEMIIVGLRISEYEIYVKYEQMSTMDTLLPNIYNKQSFQNIIEEHLERYNPTVSATLIILDLDNFKHVNDTFGHHHGDLVLKRVGEVLKRTFRDADVVGRFGGDEFMVFVPGAPDEAKIAQQCDMINDLLQLFTNEAMGITVTCSIGAICIMKNEVRSFNSIFCQADAALYEAKKNGKNMMILHKYEEDDTMFRGGVGHLVLTA